MDNKLPVYKLVISDTDDESGVDAIAFVDYPAIQLDWQAFNENKKQQFTITSEEKRIVSGAAMVADLPIYRVDEMGNEYYVVFEAETIEKIRDKFAKNGYFHSTNEMHTNKTLPGVYMVELFIVDSKRGINAPSQYKSLTDGSLIVSYKIDNDEVWEQVKSGKFKGFSVEGYFKNILKEEKPMSELDKIANDILALTELIAQKLNTK